MPDRIPVTRDRLPVRHAAPGGDPDRGGSQDHACGGGEFGAVRPPESVYRPDATTAGQQNATAQQRQSHRGERRQRAECVPPDAERAERDDGQTHHAVGQHRTERHRQSPPQAAGPADHGAGRASSKTAISTPEPKFTGLVW